MRRALAIVIVVLGLVVSAAAPAAAESATVPGHYPGSEDPGGDITEMFVDNGRRSVLFRIYGLPGPCETREVHAYVSWRGGPGQYKATAACYGGTDWVASLDYLPEGDIQNPVPVDCPTFSLTHNDAGSFFKANLPRSCLIEAPKRVRGYGEAVIYGSATGGAAGPTKLLARG